MAVGARIVQKFQEDVVVIAAEYVAVKACGRRLAQMLQHFVRSRPTIDIVAEEHQQLPAGNRAGILDDAPFCFDQRVVTAMDIAQGINGCVALCCQIDAGSSVLFHELRRSLAEKPIK